MSFAHALGHEQTAARFAAAFKDRRLHHAWLLYGVRGVGKATEAGALAALYFCESPDGEPLQACGRCHGCSMLRAGSHPDFHRVERLEGKRDISVAQVRELLTFLSLSGMESEKRVVILDDAESMNPQAANALLKGLEEPGAGSLLLMVCHDLMRLPATIRSRCMLEHCRPLDDAQSESVLRQIGVEDAALTLAMRLAQGRPGMVASLTSDEIAEALLQWHGLVGAVEKADVGEIEVWLGRHINSMPHTLIAQALLDAVQPRSMACDVPFAEQAQLLDSVWKVAAWPQEVIRHSLRAAPALLAHILELRAILRRI